MTVVLWLASLAVDRNCEHDVMRGTCLRAMARLWKLCHVRRLFFTREEALKFYRDGRRFLLAYKVLNVAAGLQEKRTWALRPKFHQLDHLFCWVLETKRNPGSHWCFSDESFVGHRVYMYDMYMYVYMHMHMYMYMYM